MAQAPSRESGATRRSGQARRRGGGGNVKRSEWLYYTIRCVDCDTPLIEPLQRAVGLALVNLGQFGYLCHGCVTLAQKQRRP